jgi:putative molybdopterin biosynthesis protein
VGSHDLVLDLAASELRAADPRVTLASSNVGSLGGLVALRDGLCHVAGSHLLDPESGEYTLPYVDRVLAGRDVAVVRLVHREQGLIVAPATRSASRASTTSPARRALRQPPARRRHAGPARPRARPPRTSRPTRSRVRARGAHASRGGGRRRRRARRRRPRRHGRRARVRPGLRAGHARALRPRARAQTLDDPAIAPLWALLGQPAFRSAVEALGGYGTQEMGRRIR